MLVPANRLIFGFALVLAASPALLPQAALSFGTVNALGQSAEHEKITRLALNPLGFEPRTLDEIAGKGGSFGAVGAPDNPARGLMSQKSAHCDGGDYLNIPGYPQSAQQARQTLASCRQWMVTQLSTAVAEAGALLDAQGNIRDSQIPTHISCTYLGQRGRAKCNVMEALGLAFHAGQDFYSHSNWTDDSASGGMSTGNPPGLGNTGRAPWLDPRTARRFPAGLISGCYDGFPESLHCDNRIRHEVLNKDAGAINVAARAIGRGTTPRSRGNANFARAVNGAVADTQNKWAYFEEQVLRTYGQARAARIICAMLRDDPAKTCR
jgi:hypothetical protein